MGVDTSFVPVHRCALAQMHNVSISNYGESCQVEKLRKSGGGAGRWAKQSKASGSERTVGKMHAVRRSRAWK